MVKGTAPKKLLLRRTLRSLALEMRPRLMAMMLILSMQIDADASVLVRCLSSIVDRGPLFLLLLTSDPSASASLLFVRS